jgi:hypothetical protein
MCLVCGGSTQILIRSSSISLPISWAIAPQSVLLLNKNGVLWEERVYMIHTALALAALPGAGWLREQNKRVTSLHDGGYLDCTGDVKLWTIASDEVDTTSELEYEFVRYYDDIKIVLIAIFISDGDQGAPIRFARKLFPRVPHGEAYADDRAFLFVPVYPETASVRSCILMPTGNDAHDDYGINASETYISQLLRTAQFVLSKH